jgi:prepilin-type N-terminal cleavage/methylation domain-containing protein
MIKLVNQIIHGNREGFTLVEVVVGMGVFAISLLAIIQIFYYGVMLNTRSKQITKAANIARKEMDTIRLMSIAELDQMPTNGSELIDMDNDGTNDYEVSWTINSQKLAVAGDYTRYVVLLSVNPMARAQGTTVGTQKDTYRLRSVLIRNPNDQN